MNAPSHSSATLSSLGLLSIRAMVGVVFRFHGSEKLFGWFGGSGLEATGQWIESIGNPFDTVSAALAGGTGFLGGLVPGLGLWPRPGAIPLAGTMPVGASTAHSGFVRSEVEWSIR